MDGFTWLATICNDECAGHAGKPEESRFVATEGFHSKKRSCLKAGALGSRKGACPHSGRGYSSIHILHIYYNISIHTYILDSSMDTNIARGVRVQVRKYAYNYILLASMHIGAVI